VPLQAAEMALLRLIHASDLPDPAELVKRLQEGRDAAAAPRLPGGGSDGPRAELPTPAESFVPPAPPASFVPPPRIEPQSAPLPDDFEALVALFRDRMEPRLAHLLSDELRLVAYAAPALTLAHDSRQSREQLAMIGKRLTEWTGTAWQVTLTSEGGGPTLHEIERAAEAARRDAARSDPLVQALFDHFPDAELTDVAAPERIRHAQSR
jgi:DNA polymerase-3 subunit gamma/tau